ncbi:hypothetical protein [Streptomyces sp. NPDC001604]|uniref:hypothetical protein n=1 Tax=Streptomyces sp. NPDC001604 TaxID=3364593 RepID=UPI0036BDA846
MNGFTYQEVKQVGEDLERITAEMTGRARRPGRGRLHGPACTKKDPHLNADGHEVIAGAFAAVLAENDGPGPSPTPSESATPGADGAPSPSESATPAPGTGTGTGTGARANSPTANRDLAETGASSSTPMFAGRVSRSWRPVPGGLLRGQAPDRR